MNAVKALHAIRASGGTAETVTDAEILSAQKLLACKEGIGVEPASAASVAGLIKLRNMGVIDRDERVVCVTTGHLLKDPETVVKMCDKPVEIDATKEAIRKPWAGNSPFSGTGFKQAASPRSRARPQRATIRYNRKR